ncbi:MAG: patatin-like phospholipase family protein [Gammaproteobacteria bacterium]|nr:patatin-like phospholipase family protein [Gammaproteobacteria bacterium]
MRLLTICFCLLLLSGCASYGVIDNTPVTEATDVQPYSIAALSGRKGSGDIALTLAFSGGGTRAAALAYGVLEELRDTTVVIDGQPRRLLDEIDNISSVSGGSFTSAYYGLYGERIFEDFKDTFLRRDVESQLLHRLFNPLRWFSSKGRTEMAVELYEQEVFHDATYADMLHAGGPLIIINASDLGYGVRFSFVQEYFDLLCSNLLTFPVARAVAASSAVPILFQPVVIEDFHDCRNQGKPEWMQEAEKRAAKNPNPALEQILRGLETYSDKENRDYAHFVDGGITDNLGLRAVYDVMEFSGGPRLFYQQVGRSPPRYVTIISVNASTDPEPEMDQSTKQPSIKETISAMSNVQLHLYNEATLDLMQMSLAKWAQDISTPDFPIKPYFVKLGFIDIEQPEQRRFFNEIPTSFTLSEEQVNRLIEAGHELLRNNPDYQRLLHDLGGARLQTSSTPAMRQR